jgi:hypothetical protein
MVEGEIIRNTTQEIEENEKWKYEYIENEIMNQIKGVIKLAIDEIMDETELIKFIEKGIKKLWITIKELETETEVIRKRKGLEMKWIRIRLTLYTTKQFELVISFFVIGTKRVFWIKDYTYTLYL